MTAKTLAEEYLRNLDIRGIKLREIEDTSLYYCFSYYHPIKNYVGQGSIFIDKMECRFCVYGSGDIDPKLDFIKKIKLENIGRETFSEFDIRNSFNITIQFIHLRNILINKLLDSKLSYTKPEIVGNDIFRIPKPYSRKLFEKRLSELPCTFNNITAEQVVELLALNKEKMAVQFSIDKHIETVKVNSVNRAK
ncbi:MAG: hypothetical protein WBG46_07275 [Nonlabens sp.]